MLSGLIAWIWAPLGGALAASVTSPAVAVKAPMVCSQGPSEQSFTAMVTLPRAAEQGATYAVRIDALPSGKIAHFGLNHIRDMATDYAVPSGAKYVAGSARIVPDTGKPNVTAGARVWYEDGLIRAILTDHVSSGSSYTPPSIEFRLQAVAPIGVSLALRLAHYRVTANAIVVGDVVTTCEPVPKLYPLGATLVTAPASPH
jgi:hypothetical protein